MVKNTTGSVTSVINLISYWITIA